MDAFIRKVVDKKLRSLPPKLEQSLREAINKIAEALSLNLDDLV